ncbi:MAG: hypothetical protein QXJ86_01870 [Nitrososphaerales archaeon]
MAGELKIRVKVGEFEVELQGEVETIAKAMDTIREIFTWMPQPTTTVSQIKPIEPLATPTTSEITQVNLPHIKIEKGDSLADIIVKMFLDPWGRSPRRLSEVREALASYGLVHPKQSVAVALLRLSQVGKLRRFKEGGEYVYTASLPLVSESSSQG